MIYQKTATNYQLEYTGSAVIDLVHQKVFQTFDDSFLQKTDNY